MYVYDIVNYSRMFAEQKLQRCCIRFELRQELECVFENKITMISKQAGKNKRTNSRKKKKKTIAVGAFNGNEFQYS